MGDALKDGDHEEEVPSPGTTFHREWRLVRMCSAGSKAKCMT